jgi:hypothetical protein
MVLGRRTGMCNILEWKEQKIIYRRYDLIGKHSENALELKTPTFLDMRHCIFAWG